jgi:hypothetical protein
MPGRRVVVVTTPSLFGVGRRIAGHLGAPPPYPEPPSRLGRGKPRPRALRSPVTSWVPIDVKGGRAPSGPPRPSEVRPRCRRSCRAQNHHGAPTKRGGTGELERGQVFVGPFGSSAGHILRRQAPFACFFAATLLSFAAAGAVGSMALAPPACGPSRGRRRLLLRGIHRPVYQVQVRGRQPASAPSTAAAASRRRPAAPR